MIAVHSSFLNSQTLDSDEGLSRKQLMLALKQLSDDDCNEFHEIHTNYDFASSTIESGKYDEVMHARLYKNWVNTDSDVIVDCILSASYEASKQIELLEEATWFDRTDIVLGLMDNDFGPGYVDMVNANVQGTISNPIRNPLLHASQAGNLDDIVALLDLGFRPFHDGFILQQAKTFEISVALLDAGADPNLKAGIHTPLSWAIGGQHFKTAKLLISRGAIIADSRLKISNPKRISYLVGCVTNCNPFETLEALDFLSFILSNESDQLSTSDLHNMLFQLVKNPFASQHIRNILDMGVSPDLFTERGNSLLCTASIVSHDNTSNISLLLDEGADIEMRSDFGISALHCAALGSNAQHVELLLSHDADFKAKDAFDKIPFDYANGFEGTQAYWALSQGKYTQD